VALSIRSSYPIGPPRIQLWCRLIRTAPPPASAPPCPNPCRPAAALYPEPRAPHRRPHPRRRCRDKTGSSSGSSMRHPLPWTAPHLIGILSRAAVRWPPGPPPPGHPTTQRNFFYFLILFNLIY
jgi:hypothetical protein